MIPPELFDQLSLPRTTPFIPPEGPLSAKIVLIGEAPGQQEEWALKPFVGGAGNLLNLLLAGCGLKREDCYITNVVKYRPPDNDFRIFYADSKLNQPTPFLTQSIRDLHAELSMLHPNVIIPLGGEALRAVTGKRGIGKWRGSIISSLWGKTIPTLHPAYILRVWGEKPIVEHDFKRASEEAKSKEINLPEHSFIIRPTLEQALEYITRCKEARRFAFDIETNGSHVRCLGLSSDPKTACCIPFTCNPSEVRLEYRKGCIPLPGGFEEGAIQECASYWSEEDEGEILKALDDLFLDPKPEKIGQNISFDTTCMAREFGFQYRNLYMDTMKAHHTCYSELGKPRDKEKKEEQQYESSGKKGLGFLVSMYTRIPFYKDHEYDDQSLWVYNCKDCVATLEISYSLDKELDERGLTEFYHNHDNPTVLSLIKIDARGVQIDVAERTRQTEAIEKQIGECISRIHSTTGNPLFNPDSDKQMKELLYGKLKLPTQYNPKTGSPTTDKNVLKMFLRDPKYILYKQLFEDLLIHSKLSTLLSSFLKKPLDENNRIYTHFDCSGTVTRRLSSSEPLFLPGTNLQNMPRREFPEFRRIFLADPDCWLLKFDLSQAEQRIVMWKARVQRVIDRWGSDPTFNIHKFIGSLIYKKPENEIKKDTDEYQISKNGGYGGNYGMAPPKAAIVYDMPVATARFVLGEYHRNIPEIERVFWKGIQLELAKTRTIVSPTGGKRIFFGRLDDATFRDAYSHFAQSIVGDIINRALHLFEEIADPTECRIHLQVHDELVFMCRRELGVLKRYIPMIKNLMEYPLLFPPIETPLVIPVEGSYGPNWYDQKDIKELLV